MKGDFSRVTFDVTKHFRRVLMQQGRVQLDADWNEQAAILLHYLQSLAKDLIGEHGGPKGNSAFKIVLTTNKNDFTISNGHYYVDGILCENEGDEKDNEGLFKYSTQPYYPLNPKDDALPVDKPFLVYLDVWEQHITSIEDPNIREVALGDTDTATRARVVWQIKIESNIPEKLVNDTDVVEFKKMVEEKWQPANRGMLKARAKQDQKKDTPCNTSPDSSYRGTENQLYRIEVHNGSGDNSTKNTPATFKWARDNGSVVADIKLSGNELTVDNPRGFSVGQWVELTNDKQELRGMAGILREIKKIDGDIFTLDVSSAINKPAGVSQEEWPTKARRWDSAEIIIVEDQHEKWITLTDGIQIQFQPPAPTTEKYRYRTGDYWLIPVRVASRDVGWPFEKGDALPPHGVEHHYAPLAIINQSEENPIRHLRREFESQAKIV